MSSQLILMSVLMSACGAVAMVWPKLVARRRYMWLRRIWNKSSKTLEPSWLLVISVRVMGAFLIVFGITAVVSVLQTMRQLS